MKYLAILCACVSVCFANPPYYAAPYAAIPHAVPLSTYHHTPISAATQYHAQDELGQVNYGYANADSAKNEVRNAFGEVAGSYAYISPEGQRIETSYTAGINGFNAAGAHLPQPVAPTPEVAAAAADHAAATTRAAIEAAANPEYVTYAGHPYAAPLAHALPYAAAAYPYGAYAHPAYAYAGLPAALPFAGPIYH